MRVVHVLRLAFLTSLSSLLVACEDGPTQTFNPLPGGGSGLINNGKSAPSTDPAVHAALDSRFPGRSLQEICPADEKKQRWSEMLRQPIIPPRKYAGIDMAKSDNWEGLTVEEAEHINCQAPPEATGQCDDGNNHGSYWGDNEEVIFCYNIGTHLAYQMVMNRGYTGTMKFHSRENGKYGTHQYEMGIDKILRDNNDVTLDWTNKDKIEAAITELFDGAMATFAAASAIPDATLDDQTNCVSSGACLKTINPDGITGIFGFRPLAIYFQTKAIGTTQPTPSHPFLIYNFYVKNEPYSNLPVTLKIDQEGPLAVGKVGPLDANNKPTDPTCTLKLGITYADFASNCLKVSGNPDIDKINVAKFLGGRTHTLEDFSFNIVGVNQNFTHVQGDFDYITDDESPTDDSIATNWTFDVRSKGKVANDITAGATDLHGTGLVFAEYAKLVQEELNKDLAADGIATHAIGAVECQGATPAKGCTGFETFMYPGFAPAGTPAQLANMYANKPGEDLGLADVYDRTYLRPGDPQAVFCRNPAGRSGCSADVLWDYSFRYVLLTLGHGDIYSIPTEARDRRFYFRLYSFALMSYMKAVGLYGMSPTLAQVDTVYRTKLDTDSVFFDNTFLAQFDKAEYVERDFMDAAHPLPMDFEYGTDVKVGNQRYTNWYSKLEREEKSLYVTMQTNKSDLPGKENNLQVTNLFGSPLIASQYISAGYKKTGVDSNGQPIYAPSGKSAYYCATTWPADEANCFDANGGAMSPPTDAANKPLVDSKGRPYFFLYKGAFPDTPTVYHYGSKALTIEEENINAGAAKVAIPNYADPYDQSSQQTPYEVLVPWFPKRAVTGFNLPLSGTRDKFIQTAQLDFSGITTTILVDYDNVRDEQGNATNVGKVLAMETQDFLGKAFLCSSGGDYLTAEMYTSVGAMLDWIDAHPGSQDDCGLIVRYSPFNNYPDFISSLVNGVRVSISQGAGFGRVVDVVLFDPALAQ